MHVILEDLALVPICYYMSNEDQILRIFQYSKRIAGIGLSNKPWRPSFGVSQYMMSQGYEIVPVNPEILESLGKTSYASLDDVPFGIEIVNIFRDSHFVSPIVDQAIALGVTCIWMQEGVRDDVAAERARIAGVFVVQDCCILKFHQRLLK